MNTVSVLHVDDDPDFADLVAAFLEREREAIEVVTETDPEAARSRFVADPDGIDCVVSDYDMPGMNGLELLGDLRTIDPDVPFLLFTGHGNEAIATEAIAAEATDYLRKDAGTEQYAVLANRVMEAVSKRRTEAERQHGEIRYERLVERSPAPIVVFGTDAITYANEAATDFLGAADPGVLCGTSPLEFVHPEDRAVVAQRIERVLEAGEAVPKTEERFVGLDGEIRHATVATAPVIEGSEPKGQAVLNEVTERTEREAELRSASDTLSTLLANVPGGVLAENGSREVLFANERFCALFDLPASPESLVGTDCRGVLEAVSDRLADPERFVASSDAHIRAREATDGEAFELTDGRTVERSGTPIEDGSDRYLWVYLDVTGRRRTERTLKALHEGTREMMTAETTDDVATIAVETACDALGLALTGIWLYDPDDVCLRPTAFTDAAYDLFEDFPTYTPGNSLSWRAFVTDEPAVYDDVSNAPDAYDPDSPIGSEIILPLGDYGVLNSGSTAPGAFDDVDVSVARILAANVESALARAEREALLRDREAQLERERDSLAALFENVPDPMYRYHREGSAVIPDAVNPAFERVFGDTDVVGRPITETIVPDDAIDTHEDLAAVARSGDRLDVEVERLTTTGRRTFLLRNAPVDTLSDDRTAGYAIYTDITERHEAEQYRRRLYEIVSDAESSAGERVRELLALGCEYLGVETGFLAKVDGDVHRIVEAHGPHEGIESGVESTLSNVYCRRTIEADDLTEILHAAESEWADDPAYERSGFETYLGSKLALDGDPYGTVCFADRSPRETDFSAVELTFVDLVTRGIASELERRRYERELERQNERLEQFASVLSHDLRNPLGIAEGYLEFVPEKGNEEPLAKVRAAHDRMERIIEDVLALTRQGETVAEPRSVSLSAVAESAWEYVDTASAELELGEDLETIDADRSRLETLFENLFRNAIEHGGSDVRVRVERTTTGFAVTDDGPGVPPAERDRVFEYGHTTSDSGTGLGLSIVRTVADAHGWDVAVTESDPGGARFEVSIPDATSS